jgi:hypothetical protein
MAVNFWPEPFADTLSTSGHRGAHASSRQRLGYVVARYFRRQRAGFSGNEAPKIGRLNRADNRGFHLRTRD